MWTASCDEASEELDYGDSSISLVLVARQGSEASFDAILDSGRPIVAILDETEEDRAKLIERYGFRMVHLGHSDLMAMPEIADSMTDGPWRTDVGRVTANALASFRVQQISSEDAELVELCQEDLVPGRTGLPRHVLVYCGQLFALTCRLYRIPYCLSANPTLLSSLQDTLRQIQIAICRDNALTVDHSRCLADVVQALQSMIDGLVDDNPKFRKLESVLKDSSNASVVCIAKDDIGPLSEVLHGNPAFKHIDICGPTDSVEAELDSVVIVGWYNRKRMRALLHSIATSEVTVLAYPQEAGWASAFIARSRRLRSWLAGVDDRESLLCNPPAAVATSEDQHGLPSEAAEEPSALEELDTESVASRRDLIQASVARIGGNPPIEWTRADSHPWFPDVACAPLAQVHLEAPPRRHTRTAASAFLLLETLQQYEEYLQRR